MSYRGKNFYGSNGRDMPEYGRFKIKEPLEPKLLPNWALIMLIIGVGYFAWQLLFR